MLRVQTSGFRETLNELKDIDPAMRKEILKMTRRSAQDLQQEAQSYVNGQGLSGWNNWRGGYDPGTIRSGIKITRAKRRKRGSTISNVVGVENTTAAGVIWELAGRRSNGAQPRSGINPKTGRTYGNGVGFVRAIRARSGQTASRLVWHAWDTEAGFHIDKARDSLINAIDNATRKIQSKLGE